jgi:hypothetical protein
MLFEEPDEPLAPTWVDDQIKASVAQTERLLGRRWVPTMLRLRAVGHRRLERFCAEMGRWDLVARQRALAEACLKRADELEPANE